MQKGKFLQVAMELVAVLADRASRAACHYESMKKLHQALLKDLQGDLCNRGPWDYIPEPTFGFFMSVWTEVASTLWVLRGVRKFYPESPINLAQDGDGVDFSEVCRSERYRCSVIKYPHENTVWNPHSWFHRFRQAARVLGTTFIILLEPDIEVRRRHAVTPAWAAGGLLDTWNPKFPPEILAYFERLGRERVPCFKANWERWGLAGGAYFRTTALLDALAPEHIDRIDWRALRAVLQKQGVSTHALDVAMTFALHARGWPVYPWEELSEWWPLTHDDDRSFTDVSEIPLEWRPGAAFEHNRKEHYREALAWSDWALVRTKPDSNATSTSSTSVKCWGCVWYADSADPSTRLPIPSEAPRRSTTVLFDQEALRKKGRPPSCRSQSFLHG